MTLYSLLELNILIHYAAVVGEYSPSSLASQDCTDHLVNTGLLEGAGSAYSATEKGEFFLNYLLSVPFPESRFYIGPPEQPDPN